MKLINTELILASTSVRRHELLKQLQVPFLIETPDFHEQQLPNEDPFTYSLRNARGKVESLLLPHSHLKRVVIGCDTIVVCDDLVLEKPKDEQDAKTMLSMLSGRTHEVLTSLVLYDPDGKHFLHQHVYSAFVEFFSICEDDIDAYIASGEPMDKSGSYSVEGPSLYFIKRIYGTKETIMGLPLAELARLLKQKLNKNDF